jgi:hypothetical protein
METIYYKILVSYKLQSFDRINNRQYRQEIMTEMVKMGTFSNIKSSVWGQVLSSILTGLFGSLLLVLFLTGLMLFGETVKHLPWIFGFNASVAGYTLLDRTRDKLQYKRLSGVGVGGFVAVPASLLLNLLTYKMSGMGLITWSELLIFGIIASVFGGLGSWLAMAYARIKGS